MYKFSEKSLENLSECDCLLQTLAHNVMGLQLFDFGISTGHRGKERQNALYNTGKTRLRFPASKHNITPSRAFDFFLWERDHINWKNEEAWYMAVGVFRGMGKFFRIPIRVGADWDGDFNTEDQSFHDLGHIELF